MARQLCFVTLTDGSGPDAGSSSPKLTCHDLSKPAPRSPARRDDEAALPAGHPISWTVLTDGTLLEGSAFSHGC